MRKSFYFIFFYKHTGVSVNKTGASFPPTALNNERCEQTKIREKNVFISSHWVLIPSLVQKREALACYNFYFGSKNQVQKRHFFEIERFRTEIRTSLDRGHTFFVNSHPSPPTQSMLKRALGTCEGGRKGEMWGVSVGEITLERRKFVFGERLN